MCNINEMMWSNNNNKLCGVLIFLYSWQCFPVTSFIIIRTVCKRVSARMLFNTTAHITLVCLCRSNMDGAQYNSFLTLGKPSLNTKKKERNFQFKLPSFVFLLYIVSGNENYDSFIIIRTPAAGLNQCIDSKFKNLE